jgi:hypothetical protein
MKFLKIKLILASIGIFQCLLVFSQDFNITNQITLGGNDFDIPYKIVEHNSNYYAIGYTRSAVSGNKTAPKYGPQDIWVIKLDNNLNEVWQKTFGGNGFEGTPDLLIDSDGFMWIVCGSSSPISGNKTVTPIGGSDYWVLKCNTNGDIIWQQVYGSTQDESSNQIIELQDGNFLISGVTFGSQSGDVSGVNNGLNGDVWLVKVDSAGSLLWEQNYGGSSGEINAFCTELSNGNIIISSTSFSDASGDKTYDSKGGLDMWTFAIDALGTILWDYSIGGSDMDHVKDVKSTNNAIYVASSSFSGISGDKTEEMSNSTAYSDAWLLKLDFNGNILWDRSFGGEGSESLNSINITNSDKIELSCSSNSGISGNKTEALIGLADYWLLSLEPNNGNIEWQKAFGGTSFDALISSILISNNHYILLGSSLSNISGDKTENCFGEEDFWIVEMTTNVSVVENNSKFNVYPNPTSNILNIETENHKVLEISIFDVNGKLLKRDVLVNNTINLESFERGFYILEIISDSGVESIKIVKE